MQPSKWSQNVFYVVLVLLYLNQDCSTYSHVRYNEDDHSPSILLSHYLIIIYFSLLLNYTGINDMRLYTIHFFYMLYYYKILNVEDSSWDIMAYLSKSYSWFKGRVYLNTGLWLHVMIFFKSTIRRFVLVPRHSKREIIISDIYEI